MPSPRSDRPTIGEDYDIYCCFESGVYFSLFYSNVALPATSATHLFIYLFIIIIIIIILIQICIKLNNI